MSWEYEPEAMRRLVPEHLQGGLRRYIEQGIRPGDGLRSIIVDAPLSDILNRVDNDTLAGLRDIYRYLYNYAPSPSFGSVEKFNAWLAHDGLAGRTGDADGGR